MKKVFFYETPLGKIALCEEKNFLTNLFFNTTTNFSDCEEKESPLLKETFSQLEKYFSGKLKTFDIPLAPVGTDFMKKIWLELQKIPYGEIKTYGEIARLIKNPKASRAVGNANGKNPIPIIIPCHRIISSDGSIGGFSAGLKIKKKLLTLENQNNTNFF